MSISTAARRAGGTFKPDRGAESSVGVATQATQQIIAFIALGAWLGASPGMGWPVSWQGAAAAGDADAPTVPSASTARAPINSNRD